MTFEQHYRSMDFTQRMQFHEINVRGTYLAIACDYERVMGDLIALFDLEVIFPNGFDSISNEEIMEGMTLYKSKKITELTMGIKLKKCKEKLEKFNKYYFDQFLNQFISIGELVDDRNLMAHGYTHYEVEQQEGKIFIFFENVQHGVIKGKIIEVNTYLDKLQITHRKVIMQLARLNLSIRQDKFGHRLQLYTP